MRLSTTSSAVHVAYCIIGVPTVCLAASAAALGPSHFGNASQLPRLPVYPQALSPSKTSVSHWQRCGCLRRPAERRAHRLLCHCRADFMPGSVSSGIETVEHWQRISASRLPVYPQRAQVRLLYPSITDGVSTASDAIPVTYCSSSASDCMPSCVSGGIRAHGTLHLFCALQSLRV